MSGRGILNVLCLQCNQDFEDIECYQQHVLDVHSAFARDPDGEGQPYSTEAGGQSAYPTSSNPTFTCGACSMKFLTEGYLIAHLDFCLGKQDSSSDGAEEKIAEVQGCVKVEDTKVKKVKVKKRHKRKSTRLDKQEEQPKKQKIGEEKATVENQGRDLSKKKQNLRAEKTGRDRQLKREKMGEEKRVKSRVITQQLEANSAKQIASKEKLPNSGSSLITRTVGNNENQRKLRHLSTRVSYNYDDVISEEDDDFMSEEDDVVISEEDYDVMDDDDDVTGDANALSSGDIITTTTLRTRIKPKGKQVKKIGKPRKVKVTKRSCSALSSRASTEDVDSRDGENDLSGEMAGAASKSKDRKLQMEPEIGNPLELGALESENGQSLDSEIGEEIADVEDSSSVIESEQGTKTFRCEKCSKQFRRQSVYENHKTVCGLPTVAVYSRCDHCHRGFATEELLKSHVCKKDFEKLSNGYKCKQCFKFMETRSGIRMHLISHRNKKTGNFRTCNICQKTLQTWDGYRKHMKGHADRNQVETIKPVLRQDKEKYLPPPVSEKYDVYINGRKVEAETKDSLSASSKAAPHICDICQKPFDSDKNLRLHVFTHNLTRTEGLYNCHLCDKKQRTFDGWRKHMAAHIESERNISYKCRKCGQRTTTLEGIKRHLKGHRDKEFGTGGNHRCHLCGCILETASGLKRHVARHEEIQTGKLYACSKCGKTMQTDSGLRKHLKGHLERDSGVQHLCDLCGRVLQSSCSLRRHKEGHRKQAASGDASVYTCSVCQQRFLTGSGLHRHYSCCHTQQELQQVGLPIKERVVNLETTKKKTYRRKRRQCRVCGLRCTSNYLLLMHEQKRHRPTSQTDHQCKDCRMLFHYPGVYRLHVRSHTGERPYQCTKCHQTYRYASALARHRKIHRWELYRSAKEVYSSLVDTNSDLNDAKTVSNVIKIYGEETAALVRRLRDEEPLGETSYFCEICHHGMATKPEYAKHMKSHAGGRPYKCIVCLKGFTTKSHLNTHKIIHTDAKPFLCTICGKMFNNKSSMKRHRLLHGNRRVSPCSQCDERFESEYLLKKHMSEQHDQQLLQCSVCKKRFLTTSHLNAHMRTHTKDKSHVCSHCGKYCSCLSSLRRHEKLHTTTSRPHQCDQCEKAYFTENELRKHRLRTHMGSDPYRCEVQGCKKTFQFRGDLNLHREQHIHPDKEVVGKFPCAECDQVFGFAIDRYAHRRKAHGRRKSRGPNNNQSGKDAPGSSSKVLTCEVCGQTFAKQYMKVHMRKHTGETLKCEICGKEYYNDVMLKNHILAHKGIKKYCCDVCGKRTITTGEMKLHKRMHTGEKPYKCQYCEKLFRDGSSRKVHEMRHRGEKPHKCSECDFAFVTAYGLRTHFARAHSEGGVKETKKQPQRQKKTSKKKPKEKIIKTETESEASDHIVYADASEDEEKPPKLEKLEDFMDEIEDSEDKQPTPLPPPVCKVEAFIESGDSSWNGKEDSFEIPPYTVSAPSSVQNKQKQKPQPSSAVIEEAPAVTMTTIIGPDSDESNDSYSCQLNQDEEASGEAVGTNRNEAATIRNISNTQTVLLDTSDLNTTSDMPATKLTSSTSQVQGISSSKGNSKGGHQKRSRKKAGSQGDSAVDQKGQRIKKGGKSTVVSEGIVVENVKNPGTSTSLETTNKGGDDASDLAAVLTSGQSSVYIGVRTDLAGQMPFSKFVNHDFEASKAGYQPQVQYEAHPSSPSVQNVHNSGNAYHSPSYHSNSTGLTPVKPQTSATHMSPLLAGFPGSRFSEANQYKGQIINSPSLNKYTTGYSALNMAAQNSSVEFVAQQDRALNYSCQSSPMANSKEVAGSSSHMTQPGSSSHMTQPGSSSHMTQPGSSGHMIQPGSSGHMTQPENSGHMTQPLSIGHMTQLAAGGGHMTPHQTADLIDGGISDYTMQLMRSLYSGVSLPGQFPHGRAGESLVQAPLLHGRPTQTESTEGLGVAPSTTSGNDQTHSAFPGAVLGFRPLN